MRTGGFQPCIGGVPSAKYSPNIQSMKVADEAFGKLPKQLFHKDFKRRNE